MYLFHRFHLNEVISAKFTNQTFNYFPFLRTIVFIITVLIMFHASVGFTMSSISIFWVIYMREIEAQHLAV